jgi:hypothetical protein
VEILEFGNHALIYPSGSKEGGNMGMFLSDGERGFCRVSL